MSAADDCRCGHGFHGHFYCWNDDCDCPEQRDTPTLAEAWDEGLSVGTGMARIYGHTDHWPEVEPSNPYAPDPRETKD